MMLNNQIESILCDSGSAAINIKKETIEDATTLNNTNIYLNDFTHFKDTLTSAVDTTPPGGVIVFSRKLTVEETKTTPMLRFGPNVTFDNISTSKKSPCIGFQKDNIELLFKNGADYNIYLFQVYIMELMDLLLAEYDEHINNEKHITTLMAETYKIIISNRESIGIDINIYSDFFSKCTAYLLNFSVISQLNVKRQEEENKNIYNKYILPMDFTKGLKKIKSSDIATPEIIEYTICGIFKNTPAIRKQIEKFPFFKLTPDFKSKAYETLDNLENLAGEYAVKLNINLTEASKRNNAPFSQKCKELANFSSTKLKLR